MQKGNDNRRTKFSMSLIVRFSLTILFYSTTTTTTTGRLNKPFKFNQNRILRNPHRQIPFFFFSHRTTRKFFDKNFFAFFIEYFNYSWYPSKIHHAEWFSVVDCLKCSSVASHMNIFQISGIKSFAFIIAILNTYYCDDSRAKKVKICFLCQNEMRKEGDNIKSTIG